jgi:hypothetical protein
MTTKELPKIISEKLADGHYSDEQIHHMQKDLHANATESFLLDKYNLHKHYHHMSATEKAVVAESLAKNVTHAVASGTASVVSTPSTPAASTALSSAWVAGETKKLTENNDVLVGSNNVNTHFDGSSKAGAVRLYTLNNADNLNGGSGVNKLKADLEAAKTVFPDNLANIHLFDVTTIGAGGAAVLNMKKADAVQNISLSNLEQPATFTNVAKTFKHLNLDNVMQNVIVTLNDDQLTATNDTAHVTIDGSTLAQLQVGVDAALAATKSGYEAMHIHSNGAPNTVTQLNAAGNSLKNITIDGSGKLTLDVKSAMDNVNNGQVTIDASKAMGDLVITDNTAGAPNANRKAVYKLGSGDDQLVLGARFSPTHTEIDGGSKHTSVSLTTAKAQAVTTNSSATLKNIDELKISDAFGAAGTLYATYFGNDVTKIHHTLDTAGTATYFVNNATTVEFADTKGPGGHQTFNFHSPNNYEVLTVKMSNKDANAHNLVASSVRNMTLEMNGVTTGNQLNSVTMHNQGTLTVKGTGSLALTAAATAGKINATLLSGPLTMAAYVTTGQDLYVHGTELADTLYSASSASDMNSYLYGTNGEDNFYVTAPTSNTKRVYINNFDPGTASAIKDKIYLSVAGTEAKAAVTDLVDTSAVSKADTNPGTVVTLTADNTPTPVAVASIVKIGFGGPYADAAAIQTAFTANTHTITYGAALTDNDAFYVAYLSTNGNTKIAIAVDNGGGASSDVVDTVIDIVEIVGCGQTCFDNLSSGNFIHSA